MESTIIADIIFFAALAGYLWYKLHHTLGRKDEDARRRIDERLSQKTEAHKVVDFPGKRDESVEKPVSSKATPPEPELTDKKLAAKVQKLKQVDKRFGLSAFLEGASMAFEMVVSAFEDGDKETLRQLLHKDIYQPLSGEIDKRSTASKREEATLVSIKSCDVKDVEMAGSKVQITVRFVSEQINLVKNKEGEVIDGDPSIVNEVEDTWTFERDVRSANPNWVIIETS